MPGKPGKKNIGKNIAEFHKGDKYAQTKRKHGAAAANKQAVAVGIAESKRKKKK